MCTGSAGVEFPKPSVFSLGRGVAINVYCSCKAAYWRHTCEHSYGIRKTAAAGFHVTSHAATHGGSMIDRYPQARIRYLGGLNMHNRQEFGFGRQQHSALLRASCLRIPRVDVVWCTR